VPADGTLIKASETGRLYGAAGGAPLYPAEACNGEICIPPVVVNQGTIDLLDHLRNLPIIGTVIQTVSGQQWRLANTLVCNPSCHDPLVAWVKTANAASAVLVPDAVAAQFTQVNPLGNLDVATVTGRNLRVQGWAFDPNTVESIQVQVRVDGAARTPVLAAVNRPDLRSAYSAYGNLHGYDTNVGLTAGTHQVCVDAINRRAGATTVTGCRTITIT
jgi:hypothetical protein